MIHTEAQEAFWQKFLAASGRDSSTPCYDYFHFCLDEKSANELLELVLAGKKRATAGSLPSYEREGVRSPQAGDLSILTDFDGKPHCVIRTTAVTVLPFRGMTYEICKREGEDDSLDSWRANHIRFFTEEGRLLGYAFSENMPVVFEDFEIVFQQ